LQTLIDRGPSGSLRNLYVHVPYCRDRCTYCAFATVLDRPAEHGSLIAALLSELRRHDLDAPIETLYIGGGTPSLLAPHNLQILLRGIASQARFASNIEVTLEANPLNIAEDELRAWRDVGVTRLSLGVQTFETSALRQLARHHDGNEAKRALENLTESWGRSWSADLLVGWSGQTPQQVVDDTEQLLRFEPPHVSVYGLTIEPGTPLQALQAKGRKVVADPELAADFDSLWSERLISAGLRRYEVSNFSKPGHASRHNSSYWRNAEYLGIGPGASSSLGPLRWSNTRDVAQYIALLSAGRSPRQRTERLSASSRLVESLAVGLRTKEGLSYAQLDERFSEAWRDEALSAFQPLIEGGFLQHTDSGIKIPSISMPIADNITSSLIRELSFGSTFS
jgi:oxygen-independent coproporphyrinogen-3 oxidase